VVRTRHRTRLAQEALAYWHDGEDQAVARYLELARRMDRTATRLLALVPRGWLLLGLLGLAPSFLTGPGAPAALAIGLGGLLLAYDAWRKLAIGLWHLAVAALAWQQAGLLFHAAARPEVATAPTFAYAPSDGTAGAGESSLVLEAHDLVFCYWDRGEPVLRGCSLRLCRGDRLLLEGPSSGGKSTLAALLMGLRQPESGLVLLGSLDRQTSGAALAPAS
jgi:ATP-binding cassette subfamily B protein